MEKKNHHHYDKCLKKFITSSLNSIFNAALVKPISNPLNIEIPFDYKNCTLIEGFIEIRRNNSQNVAMLPDAFELWFSMPGYQYWEDNLLNSSCQGLVVNRTNSTISQAGGLIAVSSDYELLRPISLGNMGTNFQMSVILKVPNPALIIATET